MDDSDLAEVFRQFAYVECEGSSLLYEHLSLEIAEDKKLLELCSHARKGQPIPNLLFGAVHYLLLKDSNDSLAQFYSSINDDVSNKTAAFPYFKSFCLEHKDQIINILKSKLVQTNEVRRCAYLYPIFCYIYQKEKRPLSLIEIGTSCGLQLLCDRYGYEYDDNKIYGNKESCLTLHSKIRNGNLDREMLRTTPVIENRVGIDLHVNDLNNKDEYLWLKALIWPEHQNRLANFKNAARQFDRASVKLLEGNGVEELITISKDINKDSILCIFHTHVANQMSEEDKYTLNKNIEIISKTRDVYHIYNNMYDRKLHMDIIVNGIKTGCLIGNVDGHARWFDWLL